MFSGWINQKRFGGNNKIAGVSVNLGATKGRGSSTRMFNYCKQRSPALPCVLINLSLFGHHMCPLHIR